MKDALSEALCVLSLLGVFIPLRFDLIGYPSLSSELELVGIVATLSLYILNIRNIRFDGIFLLLLLFCASALISTALFGDLSLYYMKGLIAFIQVWLIVKYGVNQNPASILRDMSIVLSVILMCNFIFLIYNFPNHPEGFSDELNMEMWLLGHKNQFRNWIFPAITSALLLCCIKDKKPILRTIGTMGISVISVVMANSATSTTMIVLFCILSVLYLFGFTKLRFITPATILLTFALVFFVVVILRQTPFIGDFVSVVLNRDTSFTGRSEVWDFAIESIGKNPVLGVGYHDVSTTQLITPYGQIVTHAHEAVLDTLYKYGIVGGSFALALLMVACVNLSKCVDRSISTLLALALGCYLICGVFGELYNPGFLLVLMLCCYCNRFTCEFEQAVLDKNGGEIAIESNCKYNARN